MPRDIEGPPRVGIPYRTTEDEQEERRTAYDRYLNAVVAAGGRPVEISLRMARDQIARIADSLDGFVLPGSPCDVDPAGFQAQRHPKTAAADPLREKTDTFLLEHAFRAGKPVLAICYGAQHLNVFLGGTLVQDITSEVGTEIQHSWSEKSENPEPRHSIRIEAGTKLAHMTAKQEAMVNSSHHQSALKPGRGLCVAARAPDGVIEALEWAEGAQWVLAAQWHPERAAGDDEGARLSRRLFDELIAAARPAGVTQESARI